MKAVLARCLTAAGMLAAVQLPAKADCTCRAYGRSFDHGQIACIIVPSGSFLARCDKVLNNSSWLKIQDGCPEAAAGVQQTEPADHGGDEEPRQDRQSKSASRPA